ncbi:MAG: 3-hydroxylacyl-ACP dehydratase [Acidiferrobacter sp.]
MGHPRMSEYETHEPPPVLMVAIETVRRSLPHAGEMCLLAGVRAFDQDTIECLATNHRNPHHPLRAHGRLGAACGVEYAAQAMAVHSVLLAPEPSSRPPAGALIGVRQARFAVERLDDVQADLVISCQCRARDVGGALYDFRILAADRLLLSGRATVTFASLFLTPPAELI